MVVVVVAVRIKFFGGLYRRGSGRGCSPRVSRLGWFDSITPHKFITIFLKKLDGHNIPYPCQGTHILLGSAKQIPNALESEHIRKYILLYLIK